MGYSLDMSEEVEAFVADHGFDLQFGARPLRRAIQTYLEDGLSELLVNESPAPGSTLTVKTDAANKDKLSFASIPADVPSQV